MEFKLIELASLCKSSKTLERKKAVVGLTEALSDPEAVRLLHSSDSVNWGTLFKNAHDAMILESESWKTKEAKGFGSATVASNLKNSQSLFGSLADTILKKANVSGPTIPCNDIMQACFRIFSDHYLLKKFGPIYVGMLEDNVLPIRKYRNSLKSDQWVELFDYLLNFMKIEIDDWKEWALHSVIRLMDLVVYYGYQQTYLGLQIKKKLLPLLEAKFLIFLDKPSLQEAALSLTLRVCTIIAKESRTAVCKLGELILPSIRKLYNSQENDDSSRKKLVVDFLLFQMQCHHPNGERRESGAAYACDWKIWTQQMYATYRKVFDDILKRRKTRCQNPFSDSFLNLSVELCNQLLDRSRPTYEESTTMNETNFTDDGPANKRRKTMISMEELFEELQSCRKDASGWPLISLMTGILKKYPSLLLNSDLSQLLEILSEIQCNCRSGDTMSYVYKCCEQLVKVMSVRKMNMELWFTVWETSLRSVGLNQSEGHGLLQGLISEKIPQTTGLQALLQMFQAHTIQLTNESLRTLSKLLSNFHLPESLNSIESVSQITCDKPIGSVRVVLLKWLCSASIENIDIQLFAKVVVSLIVKVNRETAITQVEPASLDLIGLRETSFEIDYCVSAFEDGLLFPSVGPVSHNVDAHQSSQSIVDSPSKKHLESFMEERYLKLEQRKEELVNGNPSYRLKAELTSDFLNYVSLLLNLLSSMVEKGVITDQSLTNCVLHNRFLNAMECLETLLPELLIPDETNPRLFANVEKTCDVLQSLYLLFGKSLSPSVNRVLCQHTHMKILDALQTLVVTFPDNHQNLDHTDDDSALLNLSLKRTFSPKLDGSRLTVVEHLHFLCLDILRAFACPPQENNFSPKQKSHIKWVLQILQDYDLSRETTFTSVFRNVSHILNCLYLDGPILRHTILLLQAVCKQWFRDAEISSYIMLLLKGIFKHAALDERNWERVCSVILLERFKTAEFGPQFTIQFMSCFEELLKVDGKLTWARWSKASDLRNVVDSDSVTVPTKALRKFYDEKQNEAVVEEVILFLLNPFHEVRLAAVSVVASLFSGQNSTPWVQTMFQRLSVILYQLFCIDKEADMSNEEAIDEGCNRTSTVLHVLASIVVSSSKCYKEALCLILRLLKEKNLKISLVQKVLNLMANPMKQKNIQGYLARLLSFVLHEWLQLGHQLQEFPFDLWGCQTFPKFFSQFKEAILPVVWKSKNQQLILNFISQEVNCPLADIFQESFPCLYAQHLAFLVEEVSTTDGKTAQKHFSSIISSIGKEKIKELIVSRIDEILLEVTSLVWDPCHHKELLGLDPVVVQPVPPFISRDGYSAVMSLLQDSIDADCDLLVYIAGWRPIVIQKVLLCLREEMNSAVTFDQKVKALHNYSAFAHAVAFHLAKGDFSKIADFLLSDITHTLLYLIRENESDPDMLDVCTGSCCLLYIMYEHLLPACSSILCDLLPTIVGFLTPLTFGNSSLAEKSLKLLSLLVTSNSSNLGLAIGQLPPFPDSKDFDQIRDVHHALKYQGINFTLEDEIRHFLRSSNSSFSLAHQNSMFGGLHFLRKQLSEKKNELSCLYRNLERVRGFSQDCKDSIIHQLISKLIGLVSSPNEKVRIEAARCLGELGPADLTTLVLKPVEGCMSIVKGYADPIMCVMALAAHFLSRYLLDHDILVVKTTSHALLSLMSCKRSDGLHSSRGGTHCIESKKIYPFIPKQPTKPKPSPSSDSRKLSDVLSDDEIWIPSTGMYHKEWVTNLVCALLLSLSDDNVFEDLASLCRVKASFAEEMLPVLFYLGLSLSSEICHKFCTRLSQFFENHYQSTMLVENSQTSEAFSGTTNILLSRPSVQCMLNVVNFVRLQMSALRDQKIELEVNYLHIASAAQFCSAYLSSIMYLELWCNGVNRHINFDNSNVAYIDFIAETQPEDGKMMQSLLLKAYEQIGDDDALYGCGSQMLLNPKTRVRQYEHMGRWDKVLLNYDVKLSHGKDRLAVTYGLSNALHHSGLLHLLNTFVGSLPSGEMEHLFPVQLECMWRLGHWSTPLPSINVTGFEWNQYSALQAVHDKNKSAVQECIFEGRLSVLNGLAHSSLENCKNIYKPLAQLQALLEIEDFASTNDVFDTMNKWANQNTLPYHDISLLEPIQAQRATLIKCSIPSLSVQNNLESSNLLLEKLTQHYLETAELARKEEQIQVAEQWLQSLSIMPHLTIENKRKLCYEEAQLAWSSSQGLSNGTSSVARHLLGSLLKDLQASWKESRTKSKLHPQALILYGKWMAEARSENPQQIIEDYLKEALVLLDELPMHNSLQEHLDAHSCLASFADLEYQRINAYIKSESFQRKVECFKAIRIESEAEVEKGNKEQMKAVHFSHQVSKLDEEEIQSTYQDRDQFIELAMKHYLMSLKLGVSNLPVFRLVSLWLENADNLLVNNLVNETLDGIQTYKFIDLLPQIAARLRDNMKDSFTKAVFKLLMQCCIEHPHHTIPLILALANSYEDFKFEQKDKPEPEPRVLGATKLLQELKKNKSVSEILSEMDRLAKALISLAYAPVPDQVKGNVSVPKGEKILLLNNLKHAMLPIISLPVQSDAKYQNVIGIHKFENKYSLAGGINKPKKISCIGTDGVKRLLLVKGKDDLRQDAVMQQVFTIMNTLLRACQETKRRRLLIRTYKIVPLSQRCGVLEWCENTSPLQEILLDVHGRYYPGDMKNGPCMKKIEAVRNKSEGERLRVFKEICKNFHPAFRFFFSEKFPTPAEWFDHRLAYVHSVATNSMVGYILGLGDRHVSNILVDQRTAELIHIDFGIAFEQGKVLPTPETVPFRLTRDIVDGMGVSGVEGVFRRSCEKTMTVLRKNQEKILTILEVLLYDPLYQWTITPKIAAKHQPVSNGTPAASTDSDGKHHLENSEKNTMAQRALFRLKEKLQGTEEGPASSVEGQVNRLIQQARDPANLSKLFRGWQAFY